MIQNAPIDLNDYYYFFHVVEKRGFAPAARALGIPKARLDARLIQRTSRQFAITDVGKAFFHHAKTIVEEANAAEARVKQRQEELTGRIRVSCSSGVAQFALEPLIVEFIKTHPKVEISQLVTNEMINLVEAGVDLAIRGHVENLPDSSMIQRRIAKVEWHLFASPRYLEDYGHPEKPDELNSHQVVCLGSNRDIAEWVLRSVTGQTHQAQFVPRLSSDDMVTLKNASAAGLGIVSLPGYVCRPDVASGRLVRVLADWVSGDATLSLLQPSRQGVLPAVSAFVEHVAKELPGHVQRLSQG